MSETFAGSPNFGRNPVTATIPAAASVSQNIDLVNGVVCAVVVPAVWDSADLTIEVSHDGTTWFGVVYNDTGSQCNQIAAPSVGEIYSFALPAMVPHRFVRIRSGTTAVPVNQSAERAVVILTRMLA